MTDAQRETEDNILLRLREELEDWRAIATEAVLAKECASRLERTIAIDPASLNWEHERTLEENRSLRNCVAGLQDDLRFANRQASKALNGEITALRTLEEMVRNREGKTE